MAQGFIIAQLGLQLVAEGVVIARFVVNLLENVLLRAVGHEMAIAAFSFAEEPDESVLRFVYGQSVWNIHLVWCCMLSYGSFRV